MWMYHMMHLLMAELCSLACMLRECKALHLALPQNITWNREGVQWIAMEWMALFWPGKGVRAFTTLCLLLSPSGPQGTLQVRSCKVSLLLYSRMFCFHGLASIREYFCVSEQTGCPCMCTCVCMYTEELQQRYEGDPYSREKVYLLIVVAQPANTTDQGHLAGLRVSQKQLN